METNLPAPRLSNSSKYILRVLKEFKVATIEKIKLETGLSRRGIMYSLRELRESGFIFVQVCLNDSRRRFY